MSDIYCYKEQKYRQNEYIWFQGTRIVDQYSKFNKSNIRKDIIHK